LLNEIFERADLEDVEVDLQLLDQAGEIEVIPPRPEDERAAHWIDPSLAGMRGEQYRIVGIGLRPGQHRLVPGPHRIHCRAKIFHVDLPAAGEPRQVEHDRLDPLVISRGAHGADHVA
jgi:hypothetical protein